MNDLLKDVQFCQASDRSSQAASVANFAILYGGIGGLGILTALLEGLFAGSPWRFVVYAGGTIAVLGFWVWPAVRRSRALRRRLATLPKGPDSAHRVSVAGVPEMIANADELQDVPFEPAIFWAPCAVVPSASHWAIWVVTFALFFGCEYLLLPRLNPTVRASLGGTPLLWAFFGVAVALYLWFRPCYLRVTPGRLEFLRYSAFRAEPIGYRAHDLRSARVILDLPGKLLHILSHDAADTVYSLMFIRRRAEFAHRVLVSALGTHAAGPVSERELTG